MKALTLRYKPYGKSFVFDAVREAMAGEGQIEDDVVYFNDISSMYKFLSPARVGLLYVIKTEKPHSLYDLAQKMGKDQGYISREIKFLKEMGIIDLEIDKSEGRERAVPVLKFDRIVFDVGIEDGPVVKKAANQ